MKIVIGDSRNVRGLGKGMFVFRLFEILKSKILKKKDQLYLRVLTTNRSIWRRKMAKWQLFKYHPEYKVCMDSVDRPQRYKGSYGILQLLQGSHLDNFPLQTLKLGWVAYHSLTFLLKC